MIFSDWYNGGRFISLTPSNNSDDADPLNKVNIRQTLSKLVE